MTGFRFADPLWLAALLPVALVVLWSVRRARRHVVVFSDLRDLVDLPQSLATRLKPWLPWLRAAGLGLVVVALARPQEGLEEFRVHTEGIDVVLALDRSGSMAALDFREAGEPVDRLHVVKRVVRDFVTGGGELAGRPDDRIALVAFSGYAEQRAPLTLDHDALLAVLDEVRLPFAGMSDHQREIAERVLTEEGRTAIGDALARSVAALRASQAKSRIVILLSDGENTAGVLTPEQAAELAAAAGVKVYTVGIGSTGSAPFRVVDAFGRATLRAFDVRLDERTLKRVAEVTGGAYFSARDTAALEDVYAAIDRLEKTASEGIVYTDYRELFELALLPAIALLLLDLLLSATRFLTLP